MIIIFNSFYSYFNNKSVYLSKIKSQLSLNRYDVKSFIKKSIFLVMKEKKYKNKKGYISIKSKMFLEINFNYPRDTKKELK